MTIREFIEEKQQQQTTDYVDIYNNASSMQRQKKYEHGLLYSSYSCQLSMSVNPSISIIDRSWNDELDNSDSYTQFKGNQQLQGSQNRTEESVSSLYCGTQKHYSSSLNTATSPPPPLPPSISLSHSNIVSNQQHQYGDRFRDLTTTPSFCADVIDNNSRSDLSLTNKNQPFNEQYGYNNNSSGLSITDIREKHADSPSNTPNTSPLQTKTNAPYMSKKYGCTICGKKFVRPSSLTTHTYSHTGEKPFQCPVERCGRRFSVISNLRRHGKVHSSLKKKKSASK